MAASNDIRNVVNFSFDGDGDTMEAVPDIDSDVAKTQAAEKMLNSMARGIPASAKEILKNRGPYNLRTGINREIFNGDGWNDQDNSGNFVPETPTKTKTRKERGARARAAQKSSVSNFSQADAVLPSIEDPSTGFGKTELHSLHLGTPERRNGVDAASVPDSPTETVATDSTSSVSPVQAQSETHGKGPPKLYQMENIQFEYVRESSISAQPEAISPTQSLASPGKPQLITTSHVHPITFNYRPPPVSDDPGQKHVGQCHFCVGNEEWSGNFYSIFGHPARKVEVIELYDGKGKTEIEGGYAAEGKEPTRMCIKCTWARMRITACDCDGHEIRHIEGISEDNFDYEAPFLTLVKQTANVEHQEQPQYKWCALCPNIAFFECCASQKFDADGHPFVMRNDMGCGLLLCESCAGIMTNDREPPFRAVPKRQLRRGIRAFRGLDRVMTLARRDRQRYQDGLRADSCFLAMNSELSWRALKGFGTEDGSMGEQREAALVRSLDAEVDAEEEGRDDTAPETVEHDRGSTCRMN